MERGSFNLRKSQVRRSGSDVTSNIFGVVMEQHHAELQNVVVSYMNHLFDDELPRTMLKARIINKREDVDMQKWKEYAEQVTAKQLDKFEVFSNDNIFGRKEVMELDDRLKMKKERIEAAVGKVLEAMNELVENRTELELEREERKYRASLKEKEAVMKMKMPAKASEK